MGLDTYAAEKINGKWAHVPSDKYNDVGPLCGGLLSGGSGSSSFRGKAYAEYVESATGESLYQDVIPNETVIAMAHDLMVEALWAMSLYRGRGRSKADEEECLEKLALAKWFKITADNGWSVLGWW